MEGWDLGRASLAFLVAGLLICMLNGFDPRNPINAHFYLVKTNLLNRAGGCRGGLVPPSKGAPDVYVVSIQASSRSQCAPPRTSPPPAGDPQVQQAHPRRFAGSGESITSPGCGAPAGRQKTSSIKERMPSSPQLNKSDVHANG